MAAQNDLASLIASGGKGLSRERTKELSLFLMEADMNFKVDMFSRMNSQCFEKCVPRNFAEQAPDLSVGETSCVERCVGKYQAALALIGELTGVGAGAAAVGSAAGSNAAAAPPPPPSPPK